MSTLMQSLQEMGRTLNFLVSTPETLYLLYLLTFTYGLFAIYNKLLQKGKLFRGRAGVAIALMFTVFSVGGIFFRFRDYESLIGAFNSFLGFIIVLLIAGGVVYLTHYLSKNSSKNSVKFFFYSLGIYIASNLLLGPLEAVSNSFEFMNVFHTFFETIAPLALLGIVIFGIGSLFSFVGSSNKDPLTGKKSGISQSKDIKEIRDLLKKINVSLSNASSHFSNKTAYLNQLVPRNGSSNSAQPQQEQNSNSSQQNQGYNFVPGGEK